MSATGQALGSEVHVSHDLLTNAGWGLWSTANPGRNEYLIVWSSFTEGSYNIYAQRVSAEATLLDANLAICRANGNQAMARVAFNSLSKGYLVVWMDGRSGAVGIYGQRVSEQGALLGGEMRLSEGSGSVGSPSVAWNADRQEYLLVWFQKVDNNLIYGRRLSPTAQPLGAPFAITQPAWQAFISVLGYDALCREYLLTWVETRDTTDQDVLGARLAGDGTLAGSRFDVSVRTEIQQPALAQNTSDGQFLIVWMDAFAGSWDIYGQRWINACLPTPSPQPSPSPTQTVTPTRTLTPTRTSLPTQTLTPTRTSTPYTVRTPLFLPIIKRGS
jgi:hypothetical protein